MDAQTCLRKMKHEGTLAMATVDEFGLPQIRCVSAVHYEPDALYFFTARGKEMAKQLLRDPHLQTLVNTQSNEMIRMSGVAYPVPENEQDKWMDIVFEEQPYLAGLYPGETRKIGVIFKVTGITLDYFNLGVKPIERGLYALDGNVNSGHGFYINNTCVECGTCLKYCPQKCISEGETYKIQQEHCLHCGACYENCPNGAVERIEN